MNTILLISFNFERSDKIQCLIVAFVVSYLISKVLSFLKDLGDIYKFNDFSFTPFWVSYIFSFIKYRFQWI